jgi:23S rRNA (pseudouridine1915-N3)-methyltransferase
MKAEFIFIGKTTEKYLSEGCDIYLKRLRNYLPAETVVIPSSTSRLPVTIVSDEGERILRRLRPADHVVSLDENGTMVGSRELSERISKLMVAGTGRIVFVTGGAYGLSDEVKKRSNLVLSFSKFTFTHQMIRLLLLEQVYRAMTILKNESYHHD